MSSVQVCATYPDSQELRYRPQPGAARFPGRCGPWKEQASTASSCPLRRGATSNRGSEAHQLLLHAFVATIEMIDTIDDRLSFGGQRANDQSGGCTKVCGHHSRTKQ